MTISTWRTWYHFQSPNRLDTWGRLLAFESTVTLEQLMFPEPESSADTR